MRSNRGERRWARVCSALDADWHRMATSLAGRRAVRRWAEEETALESVSSAHDVLAMCREGGAEGRPALRAVLRQADGDEFAQLTVLQFMLPGLLAMSRRLRFMVDVDPSRWAGEDELEQEIVAIAYERIRALGGTTQPWPATTLMNQTWRCLRMVLQRDRRHRERFEPLRPSVEVVGGADRSPAEHLAQLVVDAVHDGRLERGPAQLFYATRVLGHRLDSAAPAAGVSRWTASDRIARCAQVLADAS
jgi:hypothetical protein